MKQALKLADYEEVSQIMREMGFVYLTFAESLHALDTEFITHGGNYRKRMRDQDKSYHRFSGYVTMKLSESVNELRLKFKETLQEIVDFSSKFFTQEDSLAMSPPSGSKQKAKAYKNNALRAVIKIDSKYDGILSMPATHQKENSEHIFEKFCEGLQVAGFDTGKDKSKSQNAFILNPFHDNDEANFSMLEKEENTPSEIPRLQNFNKIVWFNNHSNIALRRGNSERAKKSEEIFFEEMSFSSDIIDFWNNKPMNRNRKRVVCDFIEDAPDNIFFSEVSTDPTARNINVDMESNNNVCHSVGDLYNFLNPDLSKDIDHQKSGADILELMHKKNYTGTNTHSSFGADPQERITLIQEKKKKKIEGEFEKFGDSPEDNDKTETMNDGFVKSESGKQESRDLKDLGNILAFEAKASGLLKTPEKKKKSEKVISLGNAMKGKINSLKKIDYVASIEVYSKERNLSILQKNDGIYLSHFEDKSKQDILLFEGNSNSKAKAQQPRSSISSSSLPKTQSSSKPLTRFTS